VYGNKQSMALGALMSEQAAKRKSSISTDTTPDQEFPSPPSKLTCINLRRDITDLETFGSHGRNFLHESPGKPTEPKSVYALR